MKTKLLLFPLILLTAAFTLHAQDVDRPVEDAAKIKLQAKRNKDLPTLFLVGDSTMRVGTPKQRGWGDEMAPYFDLNRINVLNQAIGGRSSRTFQAEGRWEAVLTMVAPGDYVIIQFGHNDGGAVNEKPPVTAKTRARGSLRGGGEETQEIDNILTKKHEVVHTFGWYMRKYANDVKTKGATPIILSLTARNAWKDGKVGRATPNSYGEWAAQAAKATGVLFIDHNDIIASEFEKMGPEKTLPMFGDGRLHTSPEGAKLNARLAIAGLKSVKELPLLNYLSDQGKAVPACVLKSIPTPPRHPAKKDHVP